MDGRWRKNRRRVEDSCRGSRATVTATVEGNKRKSGRQWRKSGRGVEEWWKGGVDERRRESRSHHTKDKSRGDKDEVVIKEEIEEVSERTKKTEDPDLPKGKKTSAMNLMTEENDVEMESD